MQRLGVNLDHIATLRMLRGTPYPSLLEAARIVQSSGAHQITVHLREDRRHIQDQDVIDLLKQNALPINLEMALSEEILRFAIKRRPAWVCLVPERRQEVTTEGGLDLRRHRIACAKAVARLKKAKIKVSLFIEPDARTVAQALELGADAVELHTGKFCLATQVKKPKALTIARERRRIAAAAQQGLSLGLAVHAGHGFDFDNVRDIVGLRDDRGLPLIQEFNIGHAIICRASLVGLEQATREMLASVQAP